MGEWQYNAAATPIHLFLTLTYLSVIVLPPHFDSAILECFLKCQSMFFISSRIARFGKWYVSSMLIWKVVDIVLAKLKMVRLQMLLEYLRLSVCVVSTGSLYEFFSRKCPLLWLLASLPVFRWCCLPFVHKFVLILLQIRLKIACFYRHGRKVIQEKIMSRHAKS